jgi:acetyl esterase/lipase
MMKSLASCLLLAIAAFPARGILPELPPVAPGLVKAGLVDEKAPPAETGAENPCANVTLTQGLKYGESDQNLLDVATSVDKDSTPRPVLLFVAGSSFADERTPVDWTMRQHAACLAARSGMVGVTMAYRRAPDHPWPAGAQDVAAATSWIHQNIDLFGGDRRAIVAVGFEVGAFHLASFLAHKEFQAADSDLAGAVLLSGIYRSDAEAGDGERSYLGADASQYDKRSAFPGILTVEEPIVLAWSAVDPPRLVAQGESLKERLCEAGHCPRTALLTNRDTPSSVFGLDGAGDSLAERLRQLLDQIEMRGLP